MAVSIVREKRNLRTAVRRTVERWAEVIDPAREVFLKPNIVFPVRQSSGEITRIDVVRALIEEIRRINPGVSISMGEGTAAGSIPEENFEVSGFARLAREMHIALIDLHKSERKEIQWEYGTVKLPRVVFESTYISLPILKQSSAAGISGALKNQKGIITVQMKKEFHKLGLDARIVALNQVMRPALTIMDCSLFFEREVFIAGDNCAEIDATVCWLLGIEEPKHVQLSREKGLLGQTCTVVGDRLTPTDVKLRPEHKEFKSFGRLRLWANPRACSMCRYLFRDLTGVPRSPNTLAVAAKLMTRAIRGAEIIMGADPVFRRERAEVICVGECTRKLAQENGYVHIAGCPPTVHQLRKGL